MCSALPQDASIASPEQIQKELLLTRLSEEMDQMAQGHLPHLQLPKQDLYRGESLRTGG